MAEAKKPAVMVKRGGPGGPRAMGPMGKPDGATIKRLLGYIFKDYKLQFFLVLVCIILNALAGVVSSLFLQTLIDDYITPMIGMENPVFTELLRLIGIMAVIYLAGVIASFVFNRNSSFSCGLIFSEITPRKTVSREESFSKDFIKLNHCL